MEDPIERYAIVEVTDTYPAFGTGYAETQSGSRVGFNDGTKGMEGARVGDVFFATIDDRNYITRADRPSEIL